MKKKLSDVPTIEEIIGAYPECNPDDNESAYLDEDLPLFIEEVDSFTNEVLNVLTADQEGLFSTAERILAEERGRIEGIPPNATD